MAVQLEDILVLRKKIENDRKKLEERERALAVLEQMLTEDMALSNQSAPQVVLTQISAAQTKSIAPINADWGSLPLQKREKKTLVGEVNGVVRKFGDREFTVHDVESAMSANGVKINGKNPRARIAMLLADLERRGEVIRTYRGIGSKPHRFKVAASQKGESPSGDDTGAFGFV